MTFGFDLPSPLDLLRFVAAASTLGIFVYLSCEFFERRRQRRRQRHPTGSSEPLPLEKRIERLEELTVLLSQAVQVLDTRIKNHGYMARGGRNEPTH